MPKDAPRPGQTLEQWRTQRAEASLKAAMREPRKRKNTEQWEAEHKSALADADTQRKLRDQHPAGTDRWDTHNEAMLRHDLYASYAYRKMHESLARNGQGLPHDVLVQWPDLGKPNWKPAQAAAWGLYRVRMAPRDLHPAKPNPYPPLKTTAAQITGASLSSVPKQKRETKRTYEHLFIYWTRRVELAQRKLDFARAKRDNHAARPAPIPFTTHKRVALCERVLAAAQRNLAWHAARRASLVTRYHDRADVPPDNNHPDSRSHNQ